MVVPGGQQPEREMSKNTRDALLAFVDFIYAIVFGLIVAKTFEEVLLELKTFGYKFSRLLLMFGVFYFLAWDWIHGRLLTLKNPYESYRRFFVEIVIAGCGYGAAGRAVEGLIAFLFYIALIFALGILWAEWTLQEYPNSPDRQELRLIRSNNIGWCIIALLFWALWERNVGPEIGLWGTVTLILIGWGMVLFDEALVDRPSGILAGPGVPFISRERVLRFRALMYKLKIWR